MSATASATIYDNAGNFNKISYENSSSVWTKNGTIDAIIATDTAIVVAETPNCFLFGFD
jgi:hypothetical protein